MKLGFIGLGSMGGAIARRLLESHPLCVHDLQPDAVDALAALGATPAAGPAEVAAASDIVLTCLPTSDEVRSVIFDAGGVAGSMADGGVIADMTTGDPVATRDMARSLAERGISLIDAPVSGGPDGAAAGTLAIIVGAPDDLFETCRPVFASISPNVFHAGDVGAGHTMKLVNNTISAGNRAIAFEAVSLAVSFRSTAPVLALVDAVFASDEARDGLRVVLGAGGGLARLHQQRLVPAAREARLQNAQVDRAAPFHLQYVRLDPVGRAELRPALAELAALDDERQRRADQAALDVGVDVVFRVGVVAVLGNQRREVLVEVALDAGVGAFLDRERAGRVGAEHARDARVDAARANRVAHQPGDVDELGAGGRLDVEDTCCAHRVSVYHDRAHHAH